MKSIKASELNRPKWQKTLGNRVASMGSNGFGTRGQVGRLDIRKTAVEYIIKYGIEAALIAWGTADTYALKGDEETCEAWMQVMRVIEVIRTQEFNADGIVRWSGFRRDS